MIDLKKVFALKILFSISNLLILILALSGCENTRNRLNMASKEPQEICEKKAAWALDEARNLASKGNNWRALGIYANISKIYPTTVSAPIALHEASRLYTERHQYNKAFDCLKTITQSYPNYSHFDQVIDEKFDIAYQLMQGERPYYLGIIPGFKDYDSSIDFFEGVIERAPFSEKSPKALLCIARLSNEHGSKTKAIEALDRLIERYAGHPLVPEAYLFEAEVYLSLVKGPQYDQGSTQKAIQCYNDFLTVFDQDNARSHVTPKQITKAKEGLEKAKSLYAESRLLMGDFFYFRRHYGKGALVFYNESAFAAPETSIAKLAQKRMEDIQNSVPAPLNFVDHILGPYLHVPPTVATPSTTKE